MVKSRLITGFFSEASMSKFFATKSFRKSVIGASLAIVLIALLTTLIITKYSPWLNAPTQLVRKSWKRAHQADSYRFTSDITQTTSPLPLPGNVGMQSTQQYARMEGQANLLQRSMFMTLTQMQATSFDQISGMQFKVEDGKAYQRSSEQEDWQETSDFSGVFAPQGDLLAFLSAAKDIRQPTEMDPCPGLLPDGSGPEGARCYLFDVNGPVFAAYMRDKLEAQLAEKGDLPPGVQLGVSEAYKNMNGKGSLWLGEDELPMTLVMDLEFPPKEDMQGKAQAQLVSARVVSTFLDYDFSTTNTGDLFWSLGSYIRNSDGRALWAAWFLALVFGVLVWANRSKKVYAALIMTLIVSMVVGPLLQQVKAGSFYREKSAEQEAQQALQEKQEQENKAQEALMQPIISPNSSPLEAAQNDRLAWQTLEEQDDAQAARLTPEEVDAEQAAISEYLAQLDAGPEKDSDSDGLPDVQEVLLGTNPDNKDTDQDSINDYVETNGFQCGGKTWYGSPNSSDTNMDGLADGLEWNKDTDNDGIPDLWSRDNDGDGVPDRFDLSPHSWKNQAFSYSSPLTLKVENAQPGRIMYLEIQVRPSDIKQLQYSSVVLKWPAPDVQGQMTDFDGKTFQDVHTTTNDNRDSFGNVRLVPALQIEINNPDLAPPKSVYELYGAVVKDLAKGSKAKVMTVPLIPQEENSGRRVAFQAKAPLLSASSWGNPLIIRPMWMVVGLVDTCKEDKWKDGKCTEVDKWNESSVLQTYPMSAVVTGLNMRENIKVDFAVVYPDASKFGGNPAEINKLDTMAVLADGLDKSFVAGRVDELSRRDMTLDTIHDRFDNTVNSGVPISPTRFAISQNIFRVKLLKGYSHPDGASAALAVTETVKILHDYQPLWSTSHPITPTLLFAQEDRFRAINLDTYEGGFSNVIWEGNQLSLNMSIVEGIINGRLYRAIPEGLSAYLNWGSYFYNPTDPNQKWKASSLQSFLNNLQTIYPLSEMDADKDVAKGMQIFLDLYYRYLYFGVGGVVSLGGKATPHYFEKDIKIASVLKSLEDLKMPLRLFLSGIVYLTLKLQEYKQIIASLGLFNSPNLRGYIGGTANLSPRLYRLWMVEVSWRIKASGIAMMIAGLALLILKLFFPNDTWAKFTVMAISGILFLAFLYIQIITFINHVRFAILLGWRYAMSYFPGGIKGCAWVMLAVSILLFVYLLYQVLSGNISWGSVQFWTAVVYLIVTIVMMIAMIIIEMIPIVGPIIIIILTILSALAQIFHLPVDPVAEFINIVVGVFYVANSISGPDAKVDKSKMSLTNPDMGMQVGNAIKMEMSVSSTDKAIDPESWQLWRFCEDWDYYRDGKKNLPRLTFKQSLSQKKKDVAGSDLDEQDKIWSNFNVDHKWEKSGYKYHVHAYMAKGSKSDAPEGKIPLEKPGANRKIDLYFNYSYASPARRCALSFICKIVQFDDKTASEIPNMYFDVFPETVDKFITWNWLTGDPADLEVEEGEDPPTVLGAPYPYPMDADGDGLIALRYSGNDPDDTNWDTDGDTLSDYFEMTSGQWAGGGSLDPTKADTDNDGLNDAEEVRWGADPRMADTDGDGLTDLEEINGFDFFYDPANQKKIRIQTNPNSRDTDRDGIMDGAEVRLHAVNPSMYPYNAAVWNLNPMNVTTSIANSPYPNGYVAAGWNGPLNYTRSVSDIGALIFEGKINTDIPKLSGHGGIADKNFKMLPGDVFTETFTVNGFNQFRGTERVDIKTTACSNLINPLFIYPYNRDPWLYNQLGSKYTPILQYNSTYTPFTYFPRQEPAPGTLGYSMGLATFNIGQKYGNGTYTNLEPQYSGPFTLAGWVNPQPPTGSQNISNEIQTVFILENSSGRSVEVKYQRNNPGGKPWNIIFSLGKPVNQSLTVSWGGPGDLPNGWAHLALVYDGKATRFFVDGSAVGTINGALERSGGVLYTGKHPSDQGSFSWVGLIDEVYFYDMAVNDLMIYRLAHPGAPSGDEGEGCTGDLVVARDIPLWVDGDNPSARVTSLTADQYINARGTLVVGGHASDPTSPVNKVEAQVDGSAWNQAGGEENWAFNWNTASYGEGYHSLAARATDLVGHLGSSTTTRVIIDRTPPRADVLSVPATADKQDNTWYLHLYGSVNDPKAGSANGSGVASLEVKLVIDGVPDAGYQLADLDAANGVWSIYYRLPTYAGLVLLPDPSGHYEVKLRSTDRVGNVADPANTRTVTFDLHRPRALFDLGGETPMGQVISKTVTFSGMVTDTSKIRRGIDKAQLAFVPQETMYVLDKSTALLHLDDPTNSNFFVDHSGKNNGATCWPPTCPTAREEGKFDKSVKFDGDKQYLTIYPPLAPNSNAFTFSFWLWNKWLANHDQRFIAGQVNQAGDATPGAWWVTLEDSNHISLSVVDSSSQVQKTSVNGDMVDRWLHVIIRIYPEGGSQHSTLTVNMNGGHTSWIGQYTYPSNLPIRLGGAPGARNNTCWIDEVVAYPFAINSEQIRALNNWQNVKWKDVSLDHRGALSTRWSIHLPSDLGDNFYMVNGRAQTRDTQEYGFLHYQPLWSGMIDLQAPAVDITHAEDFSGCSAIDLNLSADSYRCGEKTASNAHWGYFHEFSEWYRTVTTDTTRLYKLDSNTKSGGSLKVNACDKYMHCSSKTGIPDPDEAPSWLLTSEVISPTMITDSFHTVNVGTYAYAQDSLASLNINLDGLPYAGTTWGFPGVTETIWLTGWTPLAEGSYDFVSLATDFAGRVQTDTLTNTVYVDLNPPEIDINTQPITMAHMTDYEWVEFQGTARDGVKVMQVDAEVDGAGWEPAAITTTDGTDYTWELLWPLNSHEPSALFADGETFTVTARAFDSVWRETQVSKQVVIDVLPPEAITLTVSYQDGGGSWIPVQPGDTVRDPLNPNLLLEWNEATDGSGVGSYHAGFLEAGISLDINALTPYDPSGARQHTQAATEAKAYYAYVAVKDSLGNLRWNTTGPFFVDTPNTPDYFPLAAVVDSLPTGLPARQYGYPNHDWQEPDGLYRNWITPQASLLGANRAADERLPDIVGRSNPQSLAMSWDAGGLRLSWSGADWDSDGDLVIFLNTVPGSGGRTAFNPFPDTAPLSVDLPVEFSYAVWVQENNKAALMAWDGNTWVEQQQLGPEQFHFTPDYSTDLTDLYIPFGWLGVSDPNSTPLDLLALAMDAPDPETPKLEIWAALPADNPLNLQALNGPAAQPESLNEIDLNSAYHWDSLSLGGLPNLEKYQDVDLRAELISNPPGAQSQKRMQGAAWAWETEASVNGYPLASGETVQYNLVVSNTGSAPATNVRLELFSQGALILPGGLPVPGSDPVEYTQAVSLGDISPEGIAQAAWSGLVDVAFIQAQYQNCLNQHAGDPQACAVYAQLRSQARLEVRLIQGDGQLVDTLTDRHFVDADPPSDVDVVLPPGQENNQSIQGTQSTQGEGVIEIMKTAMGSSSAMAEAAERPPVYVRMGEIMVYGTADDPSDVSRVDLEVIDQSFNSYQTTCNYPDYVNWNWQCALNTPTADFFIVRATATDSNGLTSQPSPWRLFVEDDEGPDMALNSDLDQFFQGGILNSSLLVTGLITDTFQSDRLEVCLTEPEPMIWFKTYFPLVMTQQGGVAIPNTERKKKTESREETPRITCQELHADPGNTPAGVWRFTLSLPADLDGYSQNLSLVGIDAAGNRSQERLTRHLQLDNVAPKVTVDYQMLEFNLVDFQQSPFPVLSGTARDGSGFPSMSARLSGPDGNLMETILTAGESWNYIPTITQPGEYQIIVTTVDRAGNYSLVGVFEMVVH
jgi:hypothetical protein